MEGEAGWSADQEYQRRRGLDRQRRRDNRRRSLVIVALTPFVVYLLVTRVGAPLLNGSVERGTQELTSRTDPPTTPVPDAVDEETAHLVGLLLALSATVTLAKVAWGRRQPTEAWRLGAEGERRTAAILERLSRRGYQTLHDRTIPGSRANIDHVVVGPTGVFVVETKNYSGRVVIGRNHASHNGRSLGPVVDQAWREAAAVAAAVDDLVLGHHGLKIRPIVCIHGAEVQRQRWWTTPVVAGVQFCQAGALARMLRRGRAVLSAEDVKLIVWGLDRVLRPAGSVAASRPAVVEPTCSCGAAMVRRSRRADGTAFWGCSRFPRCRVTRPLAGPG